MCLCECSIHAAQFQLSYNSRVHCSPPGISEVCLHYSPTLQPCGNKAFLARIIAFLCNHSIAPCYLLMLCNLMITSP